MSEALRGYDERGGNGAMRRGLRTGECELTIHDEDREIDYCVLARYTVTPDELVVESWYVLSMSIKFRGEYRQLSTIEHQDAIDCECEQVAGNRIWKACEKDAEVCCES